VRGTKTDRPVSGDSGLSFTLELTTPEFLPGLRAVGFVDGGWISNNDVVVSADPTVATSLSKPETDHLVSVGLGLRYFLGTAFSVSADYGYLLNSSKIPLAANSSAPQRGDHRFYISLSYRF
jgi:hemolysin activation/secretion protein